MKVTSESIMRTQCRSEIGDRIPIIIEGHVYDSVIDSDGTQRFLDNDIYDYMFNHNGQGQPISHMDPHQMHTQMLNLNTLCMAYHQKKFDKRQWLEFRMPGYSVSGFCDLSGEFGDWHLTNPLWDEGSVLIEDGKITICPVLICAEEDEEDENHL